MIRFILRFVSTSALLAMAKHPELFDLVAERRAIGARALDTRHA